MSNQPWNQEGVAIEDLGSSYRGDLDPEKIVWLQIQRCNVLHSTGDEILYGNAVKSLLINVPEDIRLEVEERENEYHFSGKMWVSYRGYSADPENPFIINDYRDLDYDPQFRGRHYEIISIKDKEGKSTGETEVKEIWKTGGIHQVSPIYREQETWDYYVLQKLIMAALQNHGLTWKQERIEMATGEEWNESFNPPTDDDDGVKVEVDEPERQQPQAN